jgi:dipeptidyl aminopeptidase/acylaminoacyl peptidase
MKLFKECNRFKMYIQFNRQFWNILISIAIFSVLSIPSIQAQPLSPAEVLTMKTISDVQISPDGSWVAYTVRVPRAATDKAGSAYSQLYLVSTKTGETRPYITGQVNVSGVNWSPDGESIAFLMKRGENEKTQIWQIARQGGEARLVTELNTNILQFKWHPDGNSLYYVAEEPESKKEKLLKEKGFDFIYYQEEWKHHNLYKIEVSPDNPQQKPFQLTHNLTVWDFEISPDGKKIALAGSEKNLIDYKYMFQKIYLFDPENRQIRQLTDNPGKLGNFSFSPDGKQLAYAAALRRDDHAVSQVMVIPTNGGEAKSLTIPNFRGHVEWVAWKDNQTVIYRSGEGVWTTLSAADSKGGKRKIIFHSQDNGVILKRISYTSGFKRAAIVGETPSIPSEVYLFSDMKKLTKITNLNNWLEDRDLGNQVVIHYPARDGVEIEGLLIYPVNYQEGQSYPLVVIVHGGPESHYSNEWLTSYSQPGQILAGRGYAVFYPNYRASTGYGLEYAMKWHYGNPAGTEFDDIADGIDYLVQTGIADKERVGLGGGSYGGYAAAWFASYYTKYVRAVCMFVGISDLISKRGTTDIPYEELYVHSGKKLEEMWDLSLKRSPIYYAHQSKTAVLIFGGTTDTRVSPSQSKEFYHRLKMNNHPAVRLVQYPGERHGNSKQPGQIDVLYRTLDWYDWYVKDARLLDGPMPPLDISDKYGIELQ